MRAWMGGLAFGCEPEKAFSPPILRIGAGCLHPQEKRFALEIGARSSPASLAHRLFQPAARALADPQRA